MDLSNKPNEVLVDVLTDIISELKTAQDLNRRDALKKAARAIQKELQNRQMLPERKLSKKEIKTRDKYADDLPDKDFKKRYGKDWESVKYATATKMAKKTNEQVEQELMTEWQQEKEQPLDEIGIGLVGRYLAKRIAQRANAMRKGPPKPEDAITKKSTDTISKNTQAAQQRIDQYYGGKPQLVQSPKPSNTIDQPIKSLQTTSSKRPMPASTKKPANDPTVESLMDQWLAEKNGDMDVSLTKGNKTS